MSLLIDAVGACCLRCRILALSKLNGTNSAGLRLLFCISHFISSEVPSLDPSAFNGHCPNTEQRPILQWHGIAIEMERVEKLWDQLPPSPNARYIDYPTCRIRTHGFETHSMKSQLLSSTLAEERSTTSYQPSRRFEATKTLGETEM